MYHIEGGPLFESIEHLVEFYCICGDGLPTQLTTAITPGNYYWLRLHITVTCWWSNWYFLHMHSRITLYECVVDTRVKEYYTSVLLVNPLRFLFTDGGMKPMLLTVAMQESYMEAALLPKVQGHLSKTSWSHVTSCISCISLK